MTDRVHSLTVALEKDVRVDEIKPIITAISMIKGVLRVKQNVSTPETWMAEMRAREELRTKLWKAINDETI